MNISVGNSDTFKNWVGKKKPKMDFLLIAKSCVTWRQKSLEQMIGHILFRKAITAVKKVLWESKATERVVMVQC